jgi:hypothetical protein
MLDKVKQFFSDMNSKGVAIPILRDSSGLPSVSLTLLVISSVFVMLGLLSLAVPWLQINFWESLAWHVTSAVLYYNRGAKISKDGISIEKGDEMSKGLTLDERRAMILAMFKDSKAPKEAVTEKQELAPVEEQVDEEEELEREHVKRKQRHKKKQQGKIRPRGRR